MRRITGLFIILGLLMGASAVSAQDPSFNLPDTGQSHCYASVGGSVSCPTDGTQEFGQDANYQGLQPSYQNNGDGTVTDLVTGLMWQKEVLPQVTWPEAFSGASSFNAGGYDDWRVPTIKELYSLINFSGLTGRTEDESIPYLDTVYFDFVYGDEAAGARIIDAQYWSSTQYVGRALDGNQVVFGVNFADGRIKGYPIAGQNGEDMHFIRYVRGNENYGVNSFVDNGDGTISDQATGLTWMQADSGTGMNWAEALAWCENSEVAGYNDWRLPNAHELQSIVDYNASPDTTSTAAIDPVFASTSIVNELGEPDFPAYWTNTTHLDGRPLGAYAVYVNFGRALGFLEKPPQSGNVELLDVHGAGAQRSDPKAGDPSEFATGHGPQGDVVRISNYVRCVRGGVATVITGGETDPVIELIDQPPVLADGQEQPPQGQQPPQTGGQQQPPQGGLPGQGSGQQPPQAAIDACSGQSNGAVCSITTPNGQLAGTCTTTPDGIFACIPNQ